MMTVQIVREVSPMKSKKKSPEIDNLCELVGEFIQYWGFKSIHGKIWFHLYLSKTPLDAKDLMQKLSISKALVSISLRDLLIYDVILEDKLSAEGTRTYIANSDVKDVIERVLRGREKVMLGQIKGSFQNLLQVTSGELTEQDIEIKRVKELEKLISKGDKMLNTVMAIM
jgi:DNA-binding transcriptional regulator GbsR (MarR family)